MIHRMGECYIIVCIRAACGGGNATGSFYLQSTDSQTRRGWSSKKAGGMAGHFRGIYYLDRYHTTSTYLSVHPTKPFIVPQKLGL